MKLSVSLPQEDVEFLDAYTRQHRIPRSSALREAIAMLRISQLGAAYEEAIDEWAQSEDATLWDSTSGDGIA